MIAGVALRRWLLARAPGQLPALTVEAVHEQLCRWAAQTDAREDPVPASVEQLVSRAVRAAVLCTVAFLLPWLALPRLGPLALLLAPALLAAGLLARRRGLAWGTGVAIGAGAASALAGGTLLLDLTTQL